MADRPPDGVSMGVSGEARQASILNLQAMIQQTNLPSLLPKPWPEGLDEPSSLQFQHDADRAIFFLILFVIIIIFVVNHLLMCVSQPWL